MSNITVYLFLLENIPGFENILSLSLSNFTSEQISQCDPIKSKMIWEHNIKKKYTTLNTTTNEYNINNWKNQIYNKLNEENKPMLKYSQDFNNNNNNNVPNMYNNRYPDRPPFLVAIFESFFNITAQTCAGCLISSQYVLTASFCLDLLTCTIKNSTDTQKTSYTIIANANTNPLIDGTVHNVTEVILNKNYVNYLNETLLNHPTNIRRKMSNLALMKIEPAVKIKSLHFFEDKPKYGLRVRIYGWTLTKDVLGQDVMKTVSFGAKINHNKKCKNTKYSNEKYIICLIPENKKDVNQINSGGPVVLYHKGTLQLLSVAEIKGTFVLAYSLKPHYNWIYNTIK